MNSHRETMMISIEELEAFVHEDYADKDTMHGFAHMHRVRRLAQEIAKDHEHDAEVLMLAAYFHGTVYVREPALREFLESKSISPETVDRVIQVAWESQKEGEQETIEGAILHDAHLLEGGRTFIITKTLVTGSLRGQTLDETIAYIEENVLGKFCCCLPESQDLYEDKERFAREFLDDLKRSL
jgi:uncharacterized protein